MTTPTPILQLRIELLGIEPLIWRRIQIPAQSTLWDLHVAIQSAFGWNDSHLHEFRQPGGRRNARRFGIPTESLVGETPALPGWDYRVTDLVSPQHPRLEYCYDFGDDWHHEVIFEALLDAAPGKRYPRCLAGERAGPPDDCGGTSGYAHLLQVLADPHDEEHDAMQAWTAQTKGLRGRFDPEAFDEQSIKFASAGARLKRVLAWLSRGGD